MIIKRSLKDVLENKGVVLVSLHSGHPGEAGENPVNELSYDGYKRAQVNLDFFVGSSNTQNKDRVNFRAPLPSGMPVKFDKITHIALLDGDGLILKAGALACPLQMAHNIAPRFEVGALRVDLSKNEDWNG